MYISKLSIRNYRNFRNLSLSFQKGINTVIGENGSEKTNLLTALRLLIYDSLPRNVKFYESNFNRREEEFHTVIAFGLLNGLVPHWYAPDPTNASRKLLYVICSMAKKKFAFDSEQDRTTKAKKTYLPTGIYKTVIMYMIKQKNLVGIPQEEPPQTFILKQMSKIKILYALESAGGGTLKHVVYLATKLDKNKFDITVVLSDENYEKNTPNAVLLLRQCGIQVDFIPMTKRFSPISDIYTLAKICSYLKTRQFDIVHAHSSKAGALFRIATQWVRVPVVIYTPHCFYFTAHTGIKRWFYAEIERMLAKITDCFVIFGTEQTALHRERIKPLRKISIIDNAIDPSEYKKMDVQLIRKLWNIPEHHKVVIGVGRLTEQKNWEMLIKTAKLVLENNDAVTFIIAGEGHCHSRLSQLINSLGISAHIRLCGYLDDVSPVYSIADIFVSTSSWEGLPYTYLEALHFRVPMLITVTEGMEYFFEHAGTFPIVPITQNNCNQLSKEILKTLANRFTKIEENQISPFSITRFIESHEKLYHRLLPKSFINN